MSNEAVITVALYGDNSSFNDRTKIGDAIETALAERKLGQHVGGGSMITDPPNYNIEYEVADTHHAFALIRDTLRAMGLSRDTELLIGPNERFNLYDNTMNNLGRRPRRF